MTVLHPMIRLALVTGGSSGIGMAICRLLLEAGVDVRYCSRNPAEHEAPEMRHIASDLSTEDGAARVIRSFEGEGVSPDVVVCAAGVIDQKLVPNQSNGSMLQQFQVNLLSHIQIVRWAAGPMLLKRFGRVIGVSSTAARAPGPGQAVYAACKAGLEAYLSGCAVEFARKGLTFNSVVPGYIDTAFSTGYLAGKDLAKVVPLGRSGQPDEVAEAAMVYLGPKSGYLTGSRIVVDGGLSLAVK